MAHVLSVPRTIGTDDDEQTWHIARREFRLNGRVRHVLLHPDRAVAALAFEIVDTMLKDGHTFDDAKAAARRECLSE